MIQETIKNDSFTLINKLLDNVTEKLHRQLIKRHRRQLHIYIDSGLSSIVIQQLHNEVK